MGHSAAHTSALIITRVNTAAPHDTIVVTDPEAARAVIAPLYADRHLHTGEPMLVHADGLVSITRGLRPDSDLLTTGMLFAAHDVVRDADDWLVSRFGADVAKLVGELRQLLKLSERTRDTIDAARQSEALRKMLIAMAGDLRVVLLRLASRLQTLRWFALSKQPDKQAQAEVLSRETLQLYAPLANRLGVWQLKWELEDLAFRFLEPAAYKDIAARLDAKRVQRESYIEEAVAEMRALLTEAEIAAEVVGRPKHLYSIWSKMKARGLGFDQLYDVRALRVIVADVAACYQVLSVVHEHFKPVASEYDDYIAKPKPNGYQSLHTVVIDRAGRSLEIQIRTRDMHAFAELGVAAHWHYKEVGGAKRVTSADSERVAWLRRLLAWRDEVELRRPTGVWQERIYVLTPHAQVIELPAGATPIDFAYHVHTDLGHRCRGARVDGAMVPLNTQLATGQTVEVVVAKTGGPSRDWLNPELGFLASQRSRAKVRHWFNLVELEQTVAAGREILSRELMRLGRTAVRLDDLARRLGFETVEELCAAVTKEEFSLRGIEQALTVVQPAMDTPPALRGAIGTAAPAANAKGAVLVVGVDALLTSLARCCRPVPPDEIVGFVTRGKGVSVHRSRCPNAIALSHQKPERLIEVAWGPRLEANYPADLIVLALDRPGLLRDVSEVLVREKLNVVGVNSVSRRGEAQMSFTVEVHDIAALRRALAQVSEIPGVFAARRR